MAAENTLVLGYWAIRGLAQPIRLMLAHSGVNFEDKKVSGEEWFGKEKATMGPLANLPYLKDGDLTLTESWAISYYLAEKFGLMGDSLQDKAKVLQQVSFFRDFKQRWTQMCYRPEFEKNKEAWQKDLPALLARISALLGDHEFFSGNKLSWADFEAYELLRVNQYMDENCLAEHASLKAFVERIEALPKVKEFMASEDYIARPINAPQYAHFH